MPSTTSVSLLHKLAEQGRDADWLVFQNLYRPFVIQQIARFPDLRPQAEDLSQEVMLVVFQQLPEFHRQRKGSFRNWLRTICLHRMQDAARKLAHGRQVLAKLAESAEASSQWSVQWDREHDQHVLRQLMGRVENEFEPQTWQAFLMYAIAGRPVRQVASELNLTPNAVLLAKSRVLRRLREEASGMVEDF